MDSNHRSLTGGGSPVLGLLTSRTKPFADAGRPLALQRQLFVRDRKGACPRNGRCREFARNLNLCRHRRCVSNRNMGGNAVNGPRAADDFTTIRARLEELRRERERAKPSGKHAQPDPPLPPRGGSIRWPSSETSAGPGRIPPSGPGTHLGSVWDL